MAKKAESKASEPVRIGFIGCGGIMGGHIQRLLNQPCKIVALSDNVPAAAERFQKQYAQLKDVPFFTDWKEMLDKVEMDATIISTPHTLHYENICASLDKGLHVLTEKPMVCTIEHAKDAIARAKKAKKVLAVSYQRHFQGTYRYIRKMCTEGHLGQIQFVAAFQTQEWLHYFHGTGAWRVKMELSGGGQLNDSGSHLIDMLLWATGLAADEVSARCQFYEEEVDIDSAVSVKFTNGALGTISVIGSAPQWWEDFTVVGTKGAIYYRNGKLTHNLGFRQGATELVNSPDYSNPDQNFIQGILGKEEIQVPAECGLRVIELTEAAWKSHDQGGKVVKVPR